MRLGIEAETNRNYVMIKHAIFRDRNEKDVIIDREWTDYGIKDGRLHMQWRNCYAYSAEAPLSSQAANYAITPDEVNDMQFVGLVLEDDADADYSVSVTHIEAF